MVLQLKDSYVGVQLHLIVFKTSNSRFLGKDSALTRESLCQGEPNLVLVKMLGKNTAALRLLYSRAK